MFHRIKGLISIAFVCIALAFGAQEEDSSREDPPGTQSESTSERQQTETKEQSNRQEDASDDVFDPSEDISEDYAVPYPTDI